MHRIYFVSRFVLPALALVSLLGHIKFGVSPLGFSTGR
jgi:hypothetical protein